MTVRRFFPQTERGGWQRWRRWQQLSTCAALVGAVGLLVVAPAAAQSSAAPAKALAKTPAPATATDPAAPHTVQAPHYGDVLFRFFQDDYFNALTTLMVSQQQSRLAPHDDEAEVLRGGLLLSYGMHREAGEVFERLIERGAEPSVRRRAWFFLARIRHQRGLSAAADGALGHIDAALPGSLEDERQLLQAQVSMAQGQFDKAAKALQTLAARQVALGRRPSAETLEADTATRYARFNLGVALVRSGDVAEGQRWLEQLSQDPAGSEEQRALRDQANVALGFSALQNSQPQQAATWLERVRLKGPHANPALLGFGWAALAQKQPRQALVYWDELLSRKAPDSASLEARIARAYALSQAGAAAAALSQYEQTLAVFAQEEQNLIQTQAQLRQSQWLDALMQRNPNEHMGWQHAIEDLPELPYPQHLSPVLARHDFQELFKNQRDVLFLQRNLAEWLEKIGSYQQMLEHRRSVFAQRLPAARQQAGDVNLSRFQQRQQALEAELAQANTAADGLVFANPRQQALLNRLGRARSSLERAASADASANAPSAASPADATNPTDATSTANTRNAAERLRLLDGLLRWELAEQFTERAWLSRKALQQSQTQQTQARERLAELGRAEQEQNARFAALENRLKALAQALRDLQPQLQAQYEEQQQALQALAVQALAQQQQRLASYASQARFAMAQLHDRALSEQEALDAPTR